MREIKFRVWDKIKKEFELIDSFYELQKMNLSQKELLHKVFVQYTGLKDKNGKEIYEGDIVTEHKLRTEHFGEVNSEIIYYQDECSFEVATLSEDGKERYLTPLHKTMELEVIGNIYDNPGLIK